MSGFRDPAYQQVKSFTNVITTTVAVANATTAPTLTATGSGATLPAATYYVQYSYTNANGQTLVSAEASQAITLGQPLGITVPALPSGATGVNFFVSTTTTTETLQASQAGLTLSVTAPLVVGAAKPTVSTININVINLYTVSTGKTFNLTDFVSSNNNTTSSQVSVNGTLAGVVTTLITGYALNTSTFNATDIGATPPCSAGTVLTFQAASGAASTSVSYYVAGYEI